MSLSGTPADYYPEFAANNEATHAALWEKLAQLTKEGNVCSESCAQYHLRLTSSRRKLQRIINLCGQLTSSGISWILSSTVKREPKTVTKCRIHRRRFLRYLREVTNYPQLMLEEPIAPHCREVVAIYSNKKGRDVMKALGREEEILGILQKELGTDMRPKWYFAYETITHPVWGFKYQ